ncbi:plasmid stabilization protein [Methylobacterium indicum]|uniref:Plasmid stabilization protein n=1 Tax=Methylobacterium indicum TaxID=1775910 RepID=A0A0J6TW65_9HYPH|nr:plasmid stabilization protein [Methylobacterium indicum]KMO16916.1 plasmid stabilization protein [Methylobacterium indicum]KMO23631.1 plasmid stabilization protein [Methylobacterium indicum]KTS20944.1 plasmid stabilization protein [Methylobacterium indicum]KTS40910.1 plasmid stabilization protein [Methylobacterium indicum]KTS51900.1 plasmid stabilization protein [Methylobacterium indicum]
MKTIRFTGPALKAFAKLPDRARVQMRLKLERYAEMGTGDVKALVGVPGLRIRSGSYRAVFVETADAIEVFKVGDRRDIYE